jgi:GNAT superfamily N-acetyltransferase
MEFLFRQASAEDHAAIWEILAAAIQRRKEDGSDQWQNGYPNPSVVADDIQAGVAHVLTHGPTVVGYCAILVNSEPEYAQIKGKWLTEGDFVVYHRVAIATGYLGQGLATKILLFIDAFAQAKGIKSVRADTNYDNVGMLKTFQKQGYVYCGEVVQRGSTRKAFEKVLN